jgi:hypothetical protein
MWVTHSTTFVENIGSRIAVPSILSYGDRHSPSQILGKSERVDAAK